MIKTAKKQGFLLEELDPRMKIFLVIVLSVACFQAQNRKSFLWECAVIVMLFVLRGLFRQGRKVAVILGVLMFIEFAAEWIPQGGIKMTADLLIFFVGRMLVMVIMGYWMLSKMRVGDFAAALQNMHVPKGVVITFAVVFRYLPTVKDEFRKIHNTMKLRGVALNGKNLMTHPLRSVEYAIVPLMIRSLAVADQLAASAVTRGMDLERKKTSYREVKMQIQDVVSALGVSAVALSGLCLFQ